MLQKILTGGPARHDMVKNILLFFILLCLLSACRNNDSAVAEVFRDALQTSGGEGPEMVVLPAGSFRMGDVSGGGETVEKPLRTITLKRAIAMSRYEITFEEYDRFASVTGVMKPDPESWGAGRQPVINVSWDDAQAYADWLSKETGKTYRLPTEAEWEYAARAVTSATDRHTRYGWGNGIHCGQARYGRRGGGECSDSEDGTAPAGNFAANAFGLYDMHGNVWEWVEDCWHNNYRGAAVDARALTNGNCGFRVLRGGSWHDNPAKLRSAGRVRVSPSSRSNAIGFRVVQDLNS